MTIEISAPSALDLARADDRIHPGRCIACAPRRPGEPLPARRPDSEWSDPRPAVDLPGRVVWTHTPCGHAWGMSGRVVQVLAEELGPRPDTADAAVVRPYGSRGEALGDVNELRALDGRARYWTADEQTARRYREQAEVVRERIRARHPLLGSAVMMESVDSSRLWWALGGDTSVKRDDVLRRLSHSAAEVEAALDAIGRAAGR